MLRPLLIDKKSSLLGNECVLCKNPLAPGDEAIICPEDGSRHHSQCWQANGNKCAAYGCRGEGEIVTEVETAVANADTSENDTSLPNRIRRRVNEPANRLGCAQGCVILSIAIAIIFFSIGCFGLWAIADYIMLEVLGWQYRDPLSGQLFFSFFAVVAGLTLPF